MTTTGSSESYFCQLRSYLHSPFTPLLFFVPLGLVTAHQGSGAINPLIVFLLNGLGIIPLANLISSSVEEISEHLGDQWGGCLNATFGNLVELVVAYSALTGGLYDVVLDGLVGGLVTNLLLVLGMAAVVGGIRYRQMTFSANTSLLNAKLLLAVMLVAFVPSTLLHFGMFQSSQHHRDYSTLVSVFLLIFYGLSYIYQFFTHGKLFSNSSLPFATEELIDREDESSHSDIGQELNNKSSKRTSLLAALTVVLATTVILVFSSEALVDGLAATVQRFKLNNFFTGVFLLPLFGSAAEFVICLRAAKRNRMDLAVATTVGSSIQIVLFVLPLLVLIGSFTGHPLSIFFSPEAMVAVTASVFAVQWVTEDSSIDWFEGVFLLLVYVLLFMSSFFLL
jgi:Ca2+:H+ antiporter